ncbi:MAG: hypothetical protein ACF8Q5_14320 [Phycisphaerales bacterium JB040]
MKTVMIAAVGLASAAAPALAQTFFATRGTTLYRMDGIGGPVSTFTLSDEIIGIGQTADGMVYGVSQIPQPGDVSKLYRIDDIEGTPSLTLIPSTLSRLYTSLTAVGNDLYAFRAGGPGSTIGQLARIDKDTGVETPLASLNSFRGSGGAAYDPGTDTMWVLGDSDNTRLFTVDDYEPVGYPELAVTEVGAIGLNSPSFGLEFYRGVLYGAVTDLDTGALTLGRFNTNTGAFIGLADLDFGITEGAPTALFVIPSPATPTLALLGIGAAGIRRRR